jgi:hypothetical protein
LQRKIISFLFLLIGTALLYTAVRFLVFEPNAFKGNGDLLNTFFKTIQGIFGLVVDVYGLLPLLKKEPSALSVVPDTAKLSLDLPLIGRENDLRWLQNNSGDRVLIGQPGSGKTFLLYKFAKQEEGLFANDFNLGRVTSEYIRKKPKTIIVDDAHLNIEFIHGLINYRKRKSVTFDILASCWPSHEADVLNALNAPTSSSHYLNLLTLDQLVEVVKAVGLMGPGGLIQEIVEQSVGRPGLAVALTDLCLKEGGIQDIVLGDALARWVTTKLLPASNSEDTSAILAGFSLGGDLGMPMTTVASGLGLNLLKVQSIISNLVGGLIFDNTPNLVVYPPALRHSLVRDMFFRGAVSLSIAEFIKNAPSLHEVAKTLIGARRRGANIPQEFLLDILEQLNSGELWEKFAYLGQSEATWVLENKPQFLIAIARPALLNSPDKVIPLLLNVAIGDDRELHSSTDHPVRIIQDWVLSAYAGKGIAVRRRRILLDSIITWLNEGKTPKPAIRALQIVMTPEFSITSTSPGSGNSITWQSGHLSLLEVDALKEFWPDVLAIINNTPVQDWMPVRQIVETWAYPGRLGGVSPEAYEDMINFASQMILDMLPTISRHAGLLHWAHRLARTANLSSEVPIDSTFEILYPDIDIIDFHADSTKQRELIVELAQLWSSRNPNEVMNELLQIENETQLAGHIWPRLTPILCLELSNKVKKQHAWVEAGIRRGVVGDLIMPFLKKVMEMKGRGWIGKAQRWLQEPSLKPYVVQSVLTSPKMRKELLEEAYSNLDNMEGWIEILCLRGEIPEDRVLRLLKHNNPEVALAAAKGEWMLKPIKTVRKSLEKQWELVIINFLEEDYLLGEIFAKRSGLASSWLSARIQEATKNKDRIAGYRFERTFGIAANSLRFKERQSLLKTMPSFSYDYLIVAPLIGDSIELYQELLANKNMKHLHLNPLYGKPTDAWVLRVIAAMNSGYSANEIAHATRWGEMKIVSWSGNESGMWDEWMKNFEPYLIHPEERIREVARICIENAKYSRDRALQEELKEAVFGRN